MRKVLAAALLLAARPLFAQARAPPPAAAETTLTAPVAAGAKIWLGRHVEFEEFLRTATIDRVTKVPIGVTKPERGFFAPRGLAPSAAVKHPQLISPLWFRTTWETSRLGGT